MIGMVNGTGCKTTIIMRSFLKKKKKSRDVPMNLGEKLFYNAKNILLHLDITLSKSQTHFQSYLGLLQKDNFLKDCLKTKMGKNRINLTYIH